jgi:hypothetical protein
MKSLKIWRPQTRRIRLRSELFDLQKELKQRIFRSDKQVQKRHNRQYALLRDIKKVDQENPLIALTVCQQFKY